MHLMYFSLVFFSLCVIAPRSAKITPWSVRVYERKFFLYGSQRTEGWEGQVKHPPAAHSIIWSFWGKKEQVTWYVQVLCKLTLKYRGKTCRKGTGRQTFVVGRCGQFDSQDRILDGFKDLMGCGSMLPNMGPIFYIPDCIQSV